MGPPGGLQARIAHEKAVAQKVAADKSNLRSHYQSVQKKRQDELDQKKLKILK